MARHMSPILAVLTREEHLKGVAHETVGKHPRPKPSNFKRVDLSNHANDWREILGKVDSSHGQTISSRSSLKTYPITWNRESKTPKENSWVDLKNLRFRAIQGVWGTKITKEKAAKNPCVTPSNKYPPKWLQIGELKNLPEKPRKITQKKRAQD